MKKVWSETRLRCLLLFPENKVEDKTDDGKDNASSGVDVTDDCQ